jgi:signal transduction histidine kinase
MSSIALLVDLGWHLGFLCLGIGVVLAAEHRGEHPAQHQVADPEWRYAGTIVGVVAFGVLAAYAALDPTSDVVVAVGCIIVASLVAVRFAYSSRQEQRLAMRTRERDRLAAEIAAREATQTEMAAALETHRVANLELERLNQTKSDFVSVVSHEFRTPLTSIQGFADVLADESLSDEEVKEFAGIVGANARRLARMIDDMLDLDRIESGKARSERTPIDLNTIVTQVADTLQPGSPQHPIRLVLDGTLAPILGDRDQLHQIVTNLVGNAIKYSPDGGEITISTSQADDAILLTVQDRGIGIPPEALEKIFERFVRAAPSGYRFQGTGLGLHITQRLVELHGGRVWAESPDGTGSTFFVLLPLSSCAIVK